MSSRWPIVLEQRVEESERIHVVDAPVLPGMRWSIEGCKEIRASTLSGKTRFKIWQGQLYDCAPRFVLRGARKGAASISFRELFRLRHGQEFDAAPTFVDSTAVAPIMPDDVDDGSDSGLQVALHGSSDAKRPFWNRDSMFWRWSFALKADTSDLLFGHASADTLRICIRKYDPTRTLYGVPSPPERPWEHPELVWSARVQVVARHRVPSSAPRILADTVLVGNVADHEAELWSFVLRGLKNDQLTESDSGWEVAARVVESDTASEWEAIRFTAGGVGVAGLDSCKWGGARWGALRGRWSSDSQNVTGDWKTSSFPFRSLHFYDRFQVDLILHDAVSNVRKSADGGAIVVPRLQGGWLSARFCPDRYNMGGCESVDTVALLLGSVELRVPVSSLALDADGAIVVRSALMGTAGAQFVQGASIDGDSVLWRGNAVPVASLPFHVHPDGVREDVRSEDGLLMDLGPAVMPSFSMMARGRLTLARRDDGDTIRWHLSLSGRTATEAIPVQLAVRLPLQGTDNGGAILYGKLAAPILARSSTPRTTPEDRAPRLEAFDLDGFPKRIALDSSSETGSFFIWSMYGPLFQEQNSWRLRIHAASVDRGMLSLDNVDIRTPHGLLDSSGDRWITGFSPWWLRTESAVRNGLPLASSPRCTTAEPVSATLANGHRLEGRGWELLMNRSEDATGYSEEKAMEAQGIGILTPASILLQGGSLLDPRRPRPGCDPLPLRLDSFFVGFDGKLLYRGRIPERSDTLGAVIVSGSATLDEEDGFVVRDLRLRLRAGMLGGSASRRFENVLASWTSLLGSESLFARLALKAGDAVALPGGSLSGKGLLVELGAQGSRLRVEAPRWRPAGATADAWTPLQEAVLDMEGRPLLLTGVPDAAP